MTISLGDYSAQLLSLNDLSNGASWVIYDSPFPRATLEEILWDNKSSKHIRRVIEILYDFAYQTPKLYFRFCDEDYAAMSIEQFFETSLVHPDHIVSLKQTPGFTITAVEHPISQLAYYNFHACNTSELFKEFPPNLYLMSFLTYFGKYIGYEVSLQTIQNYVNKLSKNVEI
uniref:Autophagy_act_C domain-containing protein n=1 Tax=Rhabditophanes sp. KR3021 TaxID=114890 RepID=A0AC35UG38_9BILA